MWRNRSSSSNNRPRWRFWISRERLNPNWTATKEFDEAVSGDDDDDYDDDGDAKKLEKKRMKTTLLIL